MKRFFKKAFTKARGRSGSPKRSEKDEEKLQGAARTAGTPASGELTIHVDAARSATPAQSCSSCSTLCRRKRDQPPAEPEHDANGYVAPPAPAHGAAPAVPSGAAAGAGKGLAWGSASFQPQAGIAQTKRSGSSVSMTDLHGELEGR